MNSLRTIVVCILMCGAARGEMIDFYRSIVSQIARDLCEHAAAGDLTSTNGIKKLAHLDPALRAALAALQTELKVPPGTPAAYKISVHLGDHLKISDRIHYTAVIRTPNRAVCLRFAKRSEDSNLDLLGFAFGEVDFVPRGGKHERVRFTKCEVSRAPNAGKEEIVAFLDFLDEQGKQRKLRIGETIRGATLVDFQQVPRTERGNEVLATTTTLRIRAPDNVTYHIHLGSVVEMPLLDVLEEPVPKNQ